MEFENKQILRHKEEEQVQPGTQIQRSVESPGKEEEEEAIPSPTSIQRGVQRMASNGSNTSNQPVALTKSNARKMAMNKPGAPNQPLALTNPAVQVQQRLQGKGQNLSGETKGKVEHALGSDMTGVKIHAGAEGNQIAEEHNARALTVGKDIAFASGEYKPGTMQGDALLLHESFHTLQQKDAAEKPEKQMKEAAPQGNEQAFEKEADEAALIGTNKLWGKTDSWQGSMAGKSKPAMKSELSLQRKPKGPLEELAGGPVRSDTRIFYLNMYDPNVFKRKMGKLNILAEPNYTPMKIPKKGEYYKVEVSFTQHTDQDTKDKFNKAFPAGDIYFDGMQDSDAVALDKLIEENALLHQHSFSMLEGSNLVNTEKDEKNACIGTMHKCMQKLYPIKDLTPFGDKSITTIAELDKQGKLDGAPITIEATFAGTAIPGGTASDITFSESIGDRLFNIIKDYNEDGFYDFPTSIGNGYHSLHLVGAKKGTEIQLGWKDQSEGADRPMEGNFAVLSPAEIDAKIKAYLLGKQKFDIGQAWLRVTKTPPPKQEFHYDDIPKPKNATDRQNIADAKVEGYKTYIKDIKINRFGIAKPSA